MRGVQKDLCLIRIFDLQYTPDIYMDLTCTDVKTEF